LKLLFVSNLFPDSTTPWRGLDNVTLLHHLVDRWQIRALAIRPALPFSKREWLARPEDTDFAPEYLAPLYIPKLGSRWNHRLMASTLRRHFQEWRRRRTFDVVLASWLFPDCCAVAQLAREFGFPFLAIAQGSDAHHYLRIRARRRIMQKNLPQAAAIITRSAELARLLGDAGLPAERLHPIYNGVDVHLFRPGDRARVRQALGLPPNSPIILFVGNFYPVKNPLLPVHALAKITPSEFAAAPTLVMIGGGAAEESIRETADRLAVGKRVILPGRTDSAGVARYMQAADVLILPSHNEGVPNVILEAFACGLPVVASRVGGIPEIHPGEAFGRLVSPIEPAPFARALREVLHAPPDSAAIRQHALAFSWSRTADAYHHLLLQACE
jgi:glycosyltransferase involved in cell wall biosynthesis